MALRSRDCLRMRSPRLGLQLVPEERRIFGSLSVEENLLLAGLTAKSRWPLERVWTMFPRLQERRRSRGTDLSGGEQQMLAIARALVRRAEDHCCSTSRSRGWRRLIVRDLLATCRTLAEAGQTIVLVEQNISAAHEPRRLAPIFLTTAISSRSSRRRLCVASRNCCTAIWVSRRAADGMHPLTSGIT